MVHRPAIGCRLYRMPQPLDREVLESPSKPDSAVPPAPDLVSVVALGAIQHVPRGTRLSSLLPAAVGGSPVVAALLGHRPVSLNTRIGGEVQVEAITLATLEGQRIHRMSQALLLLEAGRRAAPDADLRLAYSVGFGRRVVPNSQWRPHLQALAELVEAAMRDLVKLDVELTESWVGVAEAMALFRRAGWDDAVELLSISREPLVPLASYGCVQAPMTGPLLARTGMIGGFRLIADKGALFLLYGHDVNPRAISAPRLVDDEAVEPEPCPEPRPAPPSERPSLAAISKEQALAVSRQTTSLMRQQLRWLQTLHIRSVGAFNRACISNHVSELIHVSEGFHEKRISRIADEIHGRGRDARVVCISGPSSSGKTTFIKRLSVQLRVLGVDPVPISLDDYYCDREKTPRNGRGELDYEALEALRLDLLEEDVIGLLKGKVVRTARYDFRTGMSHPGAGRELKLDSRSVLMLEGIHGLNPRLLPAGTEDQSFRVFICPLAQLPFDRMNWVHASDVRLMRRIVRDRRTRGWTTAENIARWEDVRHGERKHIFPFQHHADAVFDSSLIYEIAVLKVYAERYLLEVPREHKAWPTAFRLLNLVDRFVAIYPDAVPPTSILREFIGGSGFEY